MSKDPYASRFLKSHETTVGAFYRDLSRVLGCEQKIEQAVLNGSHMKVSPNRESVLKCRYST